MRRAPRARILLTPKLSVRASSADLDASRLYPLTQLTSLYRNGGLIQKAAASKDTDRDAFTEQRASLGKEITRVEHAVDRHQDAFEDGNLNPARFTERLFSLDARLDSLHSQDQALARDLAADTPTTPDTAALNAVADQLGQVIETGDPDRTKALLRILIAELRQQPQRDPPHLPRRRTRGLHAKQSSGRNLAMRKPCAGGRASGWRRLTRY